MSAILTRTLYPTALLLALVSGSLWAAPPAETEATERLQTGAGEDSEHADEDWGIWNKAPRRDGRDPLLALGQRSRRAVAPEPIDAAARGEFAAGTSGREFDLDGWGGGRVAGPSDPDDGT
jgi:hypothetical protein